MRKLAVLLALAVMLMPAASAINMPDYFYTGTMYVVGCHTDVTLRAEADTSSKALVQIPRNAQVECVPYSQQFARVTYEGQEGYVLTDYLSVDPEGDGGVYMWVVNCESWVSLRAEPRTDAERVAQLPLGTRVFVDGEDNGFCSVYIAEQELDGFVLAEYLSKD